MKKWLPLSLFALSALWLATAGAALAQDPPKGGEPPTAEEKKDDPLKKIETAATDALVKADSAWMLVSTAFVMFMVPGLALFYGGMVRRKNVLATMMQSMVCLSIVGVLWFGIGYSLAFGEPWLGAPEKSYLGFSKKLVFLNGVAPTDMLPGTNIPVYLHMLFQGMFAIITPALISGALAERIRFRAYLVFCVVWVLLVYCPLAHAVWALDWWHTTPIDPAKGNGLSAVGWLGVMGAMDFAGGTVVHIAAGFSSLAAILVLRRRLGYPEQAFHPNSMVLTLTGAGLLWFGWFGFNGGSAGGSGPLATSAFAATQVAAAAAGLSWMIVEWIHRGKPTALGLASGIVAGLVAVTPASGFVLPWAGMVIGLIAGVVCYLAVFAKTIFKYDDSLDAFGVHGVGGFLGAVLTGVFSLATVNSAGFDGAWYGQSAQVIKQFYAAAVAAVGALVVSLVLVKVIDLALGFVTSDADEVDGLDRTEHGEVGFDLGMAMESASIGQASEPRAAMVPPLGKGRFQVVLDGVNNGDLIHAWSEMCQPGKSCPTEFKAVYPYVTTVKGNRFQFRGGDQEKMRDALQKLFEKRLTGPVRARVEV